jgi:hypothetical protein
MRAVLKPRLTIARALAAAARPNHIVAAQPVMAVHKARVAVMDKRLAARKAWRAAWARKLWWPVRADRPASAGALALWPVAAMLLSIL